MKWLGYVLGGLMSLTGAVWILQGIGWLPGSFMTGQPEWAVAGAISLVIGAVVLWLTTRKEGSPSGRRGETDELESG